MSAADIWPLFEEYQRHRQEAEAKELDDVFKFFAWSGQDTQAPSQN